MNNKIHVYKSTVEIPSAFHFRKLGCKIEDFRIGRPIDRVNKMEDALWGKLSDKLSQNHAKKFYEI